MIKKLNHLLLLLSLGVLTGGCVLFGDRKVYVSGSVTDENGHPLQDVTIRLAKVELGTDTNGFFRFGGVFPGSHLIVSAIKPGFKPYEGSNKFNSYHISISLAGETSNGESKADWRILKEDELWTRGPRIN
jgi:protocatechuate 3,4-dioxygenase beta subunit